jgi:hypothetical protein
VSELIKKNEQFLDEFKNSIIQNQENNNHKIILKVPILILPTSTTDVLPWYLMVACGLESHKLIPISSNTSFAEV